MAETSLSISALSLPGYSNIKPLGSGGMADVFSATQDSFGRQVAIKVLKSEYTADKDFAKRFLQEAKIVASLSHPHIIPVYDFGELADSYYMVMECEPAGDLAKRIPAGLSEDEIMRIISEISGALEFAHSKGFIHRDIKPDNIMFREDGSAVLTDFGIARNQNANTQMTKAGQLVGTPKYMSPEQLQGGQVDGRADIYSLGIMLYEMFVKKAPYTAENLMALVFKHLNSPIPKLPKKYSRYQALFERMVAKEPEKRFGSGQEVLDLIEQIRSGEIDAVNVESSAALELKRKVERNNDPRSLPSITSVAQKGLKIPREVLVKLNDIDPLFDSGWNRTVTSVFKSLEASERRYVYGQILEPNGIVYDKQKKKFVYLGLLTVQEVLSEYIRHNELVRIGKKLLDIIVLVGSTREALVVADNIEASISMVDRFDPNDDMALQKQKIMLRDAFIYNLVLAVRSAEFDLPKNRRKLTALDFKNYLIEVFLRNQAKGYRFRTMSYADLEEHSDPFIKGHLANEARIRQCDIVKSENCFYLIGPARDYRQNTFSIRRFLQEDVGMNGGVIYFNAIAVPVKNDVFCGDPEQVSWQVSRVVTLERQLSLAIRELVKQMEESHRNELRPMLQEDVRADGTDIELAITNHLREYEKKVSFMILGKLPRALTEQAKTNDDFDYLFVNVRRLVIELACDVRDFSAQSTAAMSEAAKQMDSRMMCFLSMLDKRREKIFSPAFSETPEPKQNPALLMEEMKKVLDDYEIQLHELNVKLNDLVKKGKKRRSGTAKLLRAIFRSKKPEVTTDTLYTQIDHKKHNCFLGFVRLMKRYPLITVYLEFEAISDIREGLRNYAVLSDKDQIARLPILLTLEEKPEAFEIDEVRRMLEHTVFNSEDWSGVVH
ncbi:serine/threonine protein kinase [Gammaproteobacteria bacterium]|nr:serine/threonine protein kinase [Gammaproteobacteria bacterium]